MFYDKVLLDLKNNDVDCNEEYLLMREMLNNKQRRLKTLQSE